LKNGKRPAPHPIEVERVLDKLASHENPFIADRDWSMGKTAYRTGLRVMGLEALTCATVDALLRADGLLDEAQHVEWFAQDRIAKVRLKTALNDLIASGREHLFTDITEKGGKTRSVQFPIDVVGHLLNHIWGERHELLRKFGSSRREISARGLWLSSRSCEPLTNVAIKDILRKRGFVAAGVRGSGHSLRAAFLTEYACFLIREAKENFGNNYDAGAILLTLAEIAGHEDPKTLQHYLDEARIREALLEDREFLRQI
jgi:integrase